MLCSKLQIPENCVRSAKMIRIVSMLGVPRTPAMTVINTEFALAQTAYRTRNLSGKDWRTRYDRRGNYTGTAYLRDAYREGLRALPTNEVCALHGAAGG
jgi:hypothetical protein